MKLIGVALAIIVGILLLVMIAYLITFAARSGYLDAAKKNNPMNR